MTSWQGLAVIPVYLGPRNSAGHCGWLSFNLVLAWKGRSVVPSGHTCISLRSPLAVLSSFGSNKTFGSQALNSILAADYSEVNLKIMYHFQYISFFCRKYPNFRSLGREMPFWSPTNWDQGPEKGPEVMFNSYLHFLRKVSFKKYPVCRLYLHEHMFGKTSF